MNNRPRDPISHDKNLVFQNDRIKFNLSFCGETSAFADSIALPTPLSLYIIMLFSLKERHNVNIWMFWLCHKHANRTFFGSQG
jgi:hypothetical protein